MQDKGSSFSLAAIRTERCAFLTHGESRLGGRTYETHVLFHGDSWLLSSPAASREVAAIASSYHNVSGCLVLSVPYSPTDHSSFAPMASSICECEATKQQE